jgi:hypothetical protein
MLLRRIRLCALLCLFCGAAMVSSARAQDRSRSFDTAMSLGETISWLEKRLSLVRRVASSDSRYVRRVETRVVRAKDCSLSYTSEVETNNSSEPLSPGSQTRELWTLDLRGLNPWSVGEMGDGEVWFAASDNARNAIATSIFSGDRLRARYGNRKVGKFWARDVADAQEVAAGLRHAIELCREKER